MDPKNAARDYLLAAERYIKDSLFDEALREVKKAQEIDPSNIYTFAFLERIEFFRQQKNKENNEPHHPSPQNGTAQSGQEDITHETEDVQPVNGTAESEQPIGSDSEYGQPADRISDEEQPGDGSPDDDQDLIEVPDEAQDLNEVPDEEEQASTHDYPSPGEPESEDTEAEPVEHAENPTGSEASESDATVTDEPHEESEDVPEADDVPDESDDSFNEHPERPQVDFDDRKSGDAIALHEENERYDADEIAKRIGHLEERLDDLASAVDTDTGPDEIAAVTEKFAQIEGQLADFKKMLEEQRDAAGIRSDVQSKINELEENMRSLTDVIDVLTQQTEKVAAENDREALLTKIADLEQQLGALQQTLTEQTARDDDARLTEEKLRDIETKVNDVSVSLHREIESAKDVSDVEVKLQALQIKIEEIASSFTTDDEMHRKHAEIGSRFENLEGRLREIDDALQSAADANDLSAELEPHIEALQKQINDLTVALSEEQNDDGEYRELSGKIAALENDLVQQIGTLRDSLQEMETRDSGLGEVHPRLAGLENRIQSLADEMGKTRSGASFSSVQSRIDEFREGLEQLSGLRSRIDDLGESSRHLSENYADLERRLHEFTTETASSFVSRHDITGFEGALEELGKRIEEISASTIREQELHQTQAEILSLYTDLENRFKDLLAKTESQQADFRGEIDSRLVQSTERITKLESGLEEQSKRLHADIGDLSEQLQIAGTQIAEVRSTGQGIREVEERLERLHTDLESFSEKLHETDTGMHGKFEETAARLNQLEEKLAAHAQNSESEKNLRKEVREVNLAIDTIYQQIEEIQETLHFEKELRSKQSDLEGRVTELSARVTDLTAGIEKDRLDASANKELEEKMLKLQATFEKQQEAAERKIAEMGAFINSLKQKLHDDAQDREKQKKRQLEVGLKHFASAADKAWEFGSPSPEQAAELQNLAEVFGIPESLEKQIVREVKLKMYGRAVKKAIAEKKAKRSESVSLDTIRRQYDVSLEEYIEYESKFLDDLVSAQFQGTILLVASDEAMRKDLSERLKSIGFAVVATDAPENALQKLEMVNPHVIISEARFRSTKQSGLNLLDVLRRTVKFNYIPFIMLATQEELPQLRSAVNRPIERIVPKPVEFYELLTVIDDQLKKLRDHLSSQTL
jgi:DNA repair exonuclease SbcCD ATPase subunit